MSVGSPEGWRLLWLLGRSRPWPAPNGTVSRPNGTASRRWPRARRTPFAASTRPSATAGPNDLIAVKYLESLEAIAQGNATKIFLPTEACAVLGALGGMADLLKESAPTGETAAIGRRVSLAR